jgi:hypothetical protein
MPERPDNIQQIAGPATRQPGQATLRRLVEQTNLAERRLRCRNKQRAAEQWIVAPRTNRYCPARMLRARSGASRVNQRSRLVAER